jgi:hypothetical protein
MPLEQILRIEDVNRVVRMDGVDQGRRLGPEKWDSPSLRPSNVS